MKHKKDHREPNKMTNNPTSPVVRRFKEPGFSNTCIRFADLIVAELVRAADEARPEWLQLAKESPMALARLQDRATYRENCVGNPLVREFTMAWGRALRWPVLAAYGDGIQYALPSRVIHELKDFSNLNIVEFFLFETSDICMARLGSNDHNLDYGLYINVPIWIPLAIEPAYRESFAKQLMMTIHHETAHFRWIKGALRVEQIAHARGVASLRNQPWPRSSAELAMILESEYPEAWHNAEIRSLVQETKGGARLVSMWGLRQQRLRASEA